VPAIDLAPARIHRLLPFPGFKFHVGSVRAPFGFPEVLALELTVIALIGLVIFFRYTRAGVAVRAAAENAERAALLGIGVAGLSTLVWVIAAVLSGMNLIADGLMNDPTGLSRGTTALLAPLAAAVFARMRSLPIAVGVSVGIGMAAAATAWTYSDSQPIVSTGLFVAIVAGLLLQRRSLFRSSQTEEESSWEATAEPRPVPKELRSIATLRWARAGFVAVALLLVALLPFMFAVRIQNLLSVIAIFTIVGLSLVVLTGWSGQVSLGQFGFVAIGAAVAASLNANLHWSFWLAVPGGTIATGGVAMLIGLPALRIRGLYLAIVTFAFADAVAALFSSPKYLRDHLPRSVERPSLFFVNFADERSMYYLSVVAVLLVLVVVLNLRRSRFGRLLIAARENESNVQSFGVGLVRMKVLAFVVSGAMAGFAGSLYAFQQRGVTGAGYGADRSFQVFIFTILGGVSSAGGALLGSAYGNLSAYFLANNQAFAFFIGIIPLALLYVEPGGLITLINQVRDSWLRILAQRRQLVVPSLFADYDANALARRLIPLAPPITGQGLAGLPVNQRFALSSDVHRSDHDGELEGTTVREREAAAIGAASAASEGGE
ncbi:MAG: branched-chain amino acid ABC transporter permease, partial [Actinobacteria bacterium]|nr:branched-chain amino acid ABC transporter permease [Actinomycetota bacterium]